MLDGENEPHDNGENEVREEKTLTWRRLAVTGAIIAAVAVGSAAAGATLVPEIAGPSPTKAPEPVVSIVPQPTPAQSASPSAGASPSPSTSPRAFSEWASKLAGPLGIPQVALEAYGYAEWVLQQTNAGCKLQWTTLAAIGKVTTDHGRQSGSSLDALGRNRPPLIGPPLNGTGGVAKITDTDGGALDGDQTWDHTVGPMQFIPSMWRLSRVDADGDNLADPQDVDDAALAAAYHLCAGGKDLSVVANWKAALTAYHGLASRLDKIFEEAQSYGVRSRS